MKRSLVMTRLVSRTSLLGFALIHAIHVVILLLPTLMLTGRLQFDGPLAVFAILVALAAALESHFVQPSFNAASASIHDASAIRIASMVGGLLLLSFWSAQIERFVTHFDLPFLQFVGILAVAVGIVLRIQAIRTLGPAFNSDISVGPCVVDHGIYRWLGHPSEIGLLMIAIGGSVILGSLCTAFAMVVTLAPISAWRIRRENRVLTRISNRVSTPLI